MAIQAYPKLPASVPSAPAKQRPVGKKRRPSRSHTGAKKQGRWRFLPSIKVTARSFWALLTLVLLLNWQNREYGYMTPESGLGYALGIVGGGMMLVLLLYPLRKRIRWMRTLGPTRYWFQVHMFLGVLGPALVLLHSGFNLGSLNSTVALACMLLVAGSGLVGRYIYAKIHHGLYGRRATLEELKRDAAHSRDSASPTSTFVVQLTERQQALEKAILAPAGGPLRNTLHVLTLGPRILLGRLTLMRQVNKALQREAQHTPAVAQHRKRLHRSISRYIATHLRGVRRVAEFAVFERLFAWWHVLHLPLFLMMVLSAIVHVFAVHLY